MGVGIEIEEDLLQIQHSARRRGFAHRFVLEAGRRRTAARRFGLHDRRRRSNFGKRGHGFLRTGIQHEQTAKGNKQSNSRFVHGSFILFG
jgi:hypothetical protein